MVWRTAAEGWADSHVAAEMGLSRGKEKQPEEVGRYSPRLSTEIWDTNILIERQGWILL
jgi:hypothetical protein